MCLAYGLVFAAANVDSICDFHPRFYLCQQHGWPLTYMIRDSRVPGPFSIYYGSWPFDSPPLRLFRPVSLWLDVLCGVVLIALAATIPVYWLRARGRPVRFSLGSLSGSGGDSCLRHGANDLFDAGDRKVGHPRKRLRHLSAFPLVCLYRPRLLGAYRSALDRCPLCPRTATMARLPLDYVACRHCRWRSIVPVLNT